MQLYKFPDGTVSGPKAFEGSNNAHYSADVFRNGTPLDHLLELGVKPFREEFVPEGFTGGVPVDVEDEHELVRTYPNPVPIPGYAANKRRGEILAELALLDVFVPRSVEELCSRGTDLYMGLSEDNQARLSRKSALRAELQGLFSEERDAA